MPGFSPRVSSGSALVDLSFAERLDEAKESGPPDIQLLPRAVNVALSELVGQITEHLCARLSPLPILVSQKIIGHNLPDVRMLDSLNNADSIWPSVSLTLKRFHKREAETSLKK
jgi:hypothetical protein